MAILEVKNLAKRFGDTEVLRNIDFTLEQGEALAVIGSSGSGKTTLLRCLNFLETPDGGSIAVRGETLFDAACPATQKESELRRKRLHFGLVFQNFNLFPQYTALRNVMLAPELLAAGEGRHNDDLRERAEQLLAQVGLADKMQLYPHQLSGGQQQRVAIARALAKNPKLLLCDEPTGALDYNTGKAILKLLQDTAREKGITVVIITHNQAITAMADRIVEIKNGMVASKRINDNVVPVEEIEW